MGLKNAATNMTRLSGLLKEKKIRLTIAVYPWPQQILHGDRESKQVVFWEKWAKLEHVSFINLFPPFFQDRSPRVSYQKYFIPWDIHWNKAGHELVAEEFLKQFHP